MKKSKTFRGDKSKRVHDMCGCYLCIGSKKEEERDNRAKRKVETKKIFNDPYLE